MESNVFQIKTPAFEGPFELLLTLIEKRKLFISDISLSQVTDDFIGYIKRVGDFPMGEAAHFILVASTLLLLKSKSLLPSLSLTEEEEASIEELERRLKMYQYFQTLTKSIKNIFGVKIIFPKTYVRTIEPVFSPHKSMTLLTIHGAVTDVIERFPKPKTLPSVSVKKIISLDETIKSLTERVRKTLSISFREFAQHTKAEKIDVIVGFLAMLELVKRQIINVTQKSHFDDIHMESSEPTLPQY